MHCSCAFHPTHWHGVPRLFLTAPLSYAAETYTMPKVNSFCATENSQSVHSLSPGGATRVSRRILMVAVDQAPMPPCRMVSSQSPPGPDRCLRGNRQGVLHSTSARVRSG